jgi:hypothetical protein
MGHDNNHIIEEGGGGGGSGGGSGGEGGGGDRGVEELEEEKGGGGGIKGAPENSCTNSYVVTTNTYLSPHFLRYMPTDHGVHLVVASKANLELESHPNTL